MNPIVIKVLDLRQALIAADPFQREGMGMPASQSVVFLPRTTYL